MKSYARGICLLAAWLSSHAVTAAPDDAISYQRNAGSRISLFVREAPIAQVFEMLARKEQVNVLLGRSVEGNVSVNLFDVKPEQAIRAIAEAAGFVAERRSGTWLVIQRDEAGKDASNSNTAVRSFKVEYSDPKLVLPLVEKQLSRYGRATILEPRRLLVVEDLPEILRRIERVLAEIDRDPHQILIEAKILEVTLDESDVLGIDWSKTFGVGDGSASVGVTDLALPGAGGLFFDLLTSKYEVALTALSDKGRVRTLSTPRLLTLENQPAEVVIGDRLGYRVTTTINQVTTESVEFLESGVILRVTPSVDRNGRVVLAIHPEVSTGTINDGLPNQNTTEVTTTLVTESGKAVFIAGLIKDRETDGRFGVPVLMNIPILGRLFAQTQTIDLNTETVVILRAHLLGNSHAGPLTRASEAHTQELEQQLEENRERRRARFGPRGPGPAGEPDLGDLSD
jgi:type II secretory pathway component GspD/PulD (secretin)